MTPTYMVWTKDVQKNFACQPTHPLHSIENWVGGCIDKRRGKLPNFMKGEAIKYMFGMSSRHLRRFVQKVTGTPTHVVAQRP